MLRFHHREPIFQNFPGGHAPDPPRVRNAKACLAILHTAASLSVLLCPTTNGELQPPLVATRESVSVDKEYSKKYGGQASVDNYKR